MRRRQGGDSNRVIRIIPYHFIHVLDKNTNLTRLEKGPNTFVRKDHEQLALKPTEMIKIPPRNYCGVVNPHVRDENGEPVIGENGMVELKLGQQEIRLAKDWEAPFALYPGEAIYIKVRKMTVVNADNALRIVATRDFTTADGTERKAGDQWLFPGPSTYVPNINETVIEKIIAFVIKPNNALRLRAQREFTDKTGTVRKKGEEWLVREVGSYMFDTFEQMVAQAKSKVLTEKKALHLTAIRTFTDAYGKLRKAGTEWLVTNADSQTHLLDINEKHIGDVPIKIVTQQQYCVVLNPANKDGVNQWGQREMRKGEVQFFLQPGERLENGIQEAHVLAWDEALHLRARVLFTDESKTERKPGQEWLLKGPCKYIPPIEVELMGNKRKSIPLDDNEGIYVKNKRTGAIRTVKGQTYMLKADEERWTKVFPQHIEQLLTQKSGNQYGRGASRGRDMFKAVTYRVPHNSAVQIYDYRDMKARVVFGPEMVMLEPHEEFTIQNLSGNMPKQPNVDQRLSLSLGPDFMKDQVIVDTSDHAKLKLILSYNWVFEIDRRNKEHEKQIFSVKDYVGDTCKALASRVRGAVATSTFDAFHKDSANIIRKAVFGTDGEGNPLEKLVFKSNNLAITNIDVQTVEPVAQRTRDALQKSVQTTIEIQRQNQQKLANHEAQKEEQIAQGELLLNKTKDDILAETSKTRLVELQAETAIAAAVGKSRAEAEARLDEAMIMAKAAVEQAKKKAEAQAIRSEARLTQTKMAQKQEIEHKKAIDKIEVERAKKEAMIECEKFKDIVDAIGPSTIEAIARAGPEMQANLLEGLGLQGFLVTDGTSPINLFNTASGLVGGPQ